MNCLIILHLLLLVQNKMNFLYQKFAEEFNNNEICCFQRKANTYEIHVIALSKDFDSWHHLKRTNNLFEKHGGKFAYKMFILEDQIFVKKLFI